ncbi:helix-turn-helix domain-containing protein [Polyangium aurulentum]|uniref:helix-turn-helix domain-containing protein n=1 Tax=Polyangium aurulentum TaxID=2567896 RepID=UPI0010AEA79B|nr:helix-turn-helix transcriptional regulator [Polyangium aurulentum]UQA59470.1 helix-turn-helix transcriptional regulator [Polyangium aurulentum]
MLHDRSFPPPAHLAAHVAGVWRLSGDGEGAPDWLLPDVGGADIAIHLGGPGHLFFGGEWSEQPARFVVGGLSRALGLRHARSTDTLVIHLPPGCACLLGVPAAALRGTVAALGDIAPRLDRDLARWSDAALSKRSGVAELYAVLGAHVRPHCDPLMKRVAASFVREAELSVERLAGALEMSRRHLNRRFQESVGWTPRDFKRLARFARAWRIAGTGPVTSWAAVAADAGYFDQAHLVRDFKDLTGETPTQLFSTAWYDAIALDPATYAPMSHPSKTGT